MQVDNIHRLIPMIVKKDPLVSFQWQSNFLSQTLNVVLPRRMIFLWPIICRPNRLSNEQSHKLHNAQTNEN